MRRRSRSLPFNGLSLWNKMLMRRWEEEPSFQMLTTSSVGGDGNWWQTTFPHKILFNCAGKEFDYTRRITGIKDFVLLVFGWGGVSLENGLIVGGRFGIFGPFANSFADRIRKTKGATEWNFLFRFKYKSILSSILSMAKTKRQMLNQF